MTDKDEWGPWIEHDGSGCPVRVGTLVLAEGSYGGQQEARVTFASFHRSTSQWFGPRTDGYDYIIRYCIRKPRGLDTLQEIAENPRRELEHT